MNRKSESASTHRLFALTLWVCVRSYSFLLFLTHRWLYLPGNDCGSSFVVIVIVIINFPSLFSLVCLHFAIQKKCISFVERVRPFVVGRRSFVTMLPWHLNKVKVTVETDQDLCQRSSASMPELSHSFRCTLFALHRVLCSLNQSAGLSHVAHRWSHCTFSNTTANAFGATVIWEKGLRCHTMNELWLLFLSFFSCFLFGKTDFSFLRIAHLSHRSFWWICVLFALVVLFSLCAHN